MSKRSIISIIISLIVGISFLIVGFDFDSRLTHQFFPYPELVYARLFILTGTIIIFLAVFSGIYIYDRSYRKHRVEKIKEDSKNIVDYLKTDNSGITQLKLASVLQIDRKKIKKCLNHLEWVGVVEKKKVSAEETLFFYKKE